MSSLSLAVIYSSDNDDFPVKKNLKMGNFGVEGSLGVDSSHRSWVPIHLQPSPFFKKEAGLGKEPSN